MREFRDLNSWEKLGVWGSAASLIALLITVFPSLGPSGEQVDPPPPPSSTGASESTGVDPSVEPAEQIPEAQTPTFPVEGDWDMQLTGTALIDFRKRKRPAKNKGEIRIRLQENGDAISGKFLWADVCAEAEIDGQRSGNKLDFTMLYQGSCCGGSVARFIGEVVSPRTFVGSYEPVDAPPLSGCNLWWAKAVGRKAD